MNSFRLQLLLILGIYIQGVLTNARYNNGMWCNTTLAVDDTQWRHLVYYFYRFPIPSQINIFLQFCCSLVSCLRSCLVPGTKASLARLRNEGARDGESAGQTTGGGAEEHAGQVDTRGQQWWRGRSEKGVPTGETGHNEHSASCTQGFQCESSLFTCVHYLLHLLCAM